MNKLAVKYLMKFQYIVILTDWDDNVLILQYYWELSKSIKNEIVWWDCFKEF